VRAGGGAFGRRGGLDALVDLVENVVLELFQNQIVDQLVDIGVLTLGAEVRQICVYRWREVLTQVLNRDQVVPVH